MLFIASKPIDALTLTAKFWQTKIDWAKYVVGQPPPDENPAPPATEYKNELALYPELRKALSKDLNGQPTLDLNVAISRMIAVSRRQMLEARVAISKHYNQQPH